MAFRVKGALSPSFCDLLDHLACFSIPPLLLSSLRIKSETLLQGSSLSRVQDLALACRISSLFADLTQGRNANNPGSCSEGQECQ